jgi:pantoate--beta-alanine ligase
MQQLTDRNTIRAWRAGTSGSVGLVPTMGALHAGHMALVDAARRENDQVCVSIFVNPKQFAAQEDLATYPRTLDADLGLLRRAGVDAVFMPDVAAMYPPGSRTSIHVAELTSQLEGASRPGHFDGVCLVVAKLFNLIQPHRAYFGWKDAQQVRVIQQMVDDIDFPVEVRPQPTVRDHDGLALSSRNQGLSEAGRVAARRISEALDLVSQAVQSGDREASSLRDVASEHLSTHPQLSVDYIEIVDLQSLQPVISLDRPTLLVVAVICNDIRLIDNLLIEP